MKSIRKNHVSHLTSALFFKLWISLLAGFGGSSDSGKTIDQDDIDKVIENYGCPQGLCE